MSACLRAVALMGATGSGKSELAMQLAAGASVPVISCDSMQVYRGLDIGTAKPTPAERRRVRHELIDCCDLEKRPPDRYSAARWAADARRLVIEANRHGQTPLIVGGTGLYLRALLQPLADIPEVDAAVRQAIESECAQHGAARLHERLRRCDPLLAARLKPNDSQRIMRALAVFESSGRPLSAWQADAVPEAETIHCPVFVLELERDALRERIARRFHAMMEAGWLDEARWLDGLKLPASHPAMRAVGYRQLLDYLHGLTDLEQAVAWGITATRKYAKRQRTWFRHQQPDACFGEASMLADRIREALA